MKFAEGGQSVSGLHASPSQEGECRSLQFVAGNAVKTARVVVELSVC